jgi:phosphohistidine phosphatase
MDLYIIRHAWAAERDDLRWPNDEERPLTDEGRERFAKFVARLAAVDFAPKLIASSPLVRCAETAQIIRKHAPGKPSVVFRDELRPGGQWESLLQWTAQQAREHDPIAWVGHAPDVSLLAAALIGDGEATLRFAKGAVAAIRFDGPIEPGQGELRWLTTAKLLGC